MKKVIANARGYLGSLREPGDVFLVDDNLEATWFDPVPEAPAKEGKETKGGKGGSKPDGSDLV